MSEISPGRDPAGDLPTTMPSQEHTKLRDHSTPSPVRQLPSSTTPIWDPQREQRFWVLTAIPSGLVSAIVHLLLLISLATWILTADFGSTSISLEVVVAEPMVEPEPLEEIAVEIDTIEEVAELEASPQDQLEQDVQLEETVEPVVVEPLTPAVKQAKLPAVGMHAGRGDSSGSIVGGASGRADRRERAFEFGATPESENAVDLALAWIARHQRSDGSWSFDHRRGDHDCESCGCPNPGSAVAALNGATAMGLLPLLGAGNTHLRGEYREQVAAGIAYLLSHQRADGSFHEPAGNMYSHGLATLALCETLAMARGQWNAIAAPEQTTLTGEPRSAEVVPSASLSSMLRRSHPVGEPMDRDLPASGSSPKIDPELLVSAARNAMKFIERAQHRGGGWRYKPKEAGDTSVVGWQLMALKSGHLAGLPVRAETIQGARRFLSGASIDRHGSCYGYRARSQRRKPKLSMEREVGATTAIGLLCRMYTGWDRQREGIQIGVRRLNRWRRPRKGLYHYYYATQVMHHYGGPAWDAWNNWMREHLLDTQEVTGSQRGSWQLDGSHDNAGRLYCTAMATMTLEVYYRYSPIYGEAAIAD